MSTVTVTATLEASNTPPRVRLNVASADATSTTITRLNPDGTAVPVRTTDGMPAPINSGTAVLYDYEAPFGVPVSYSSVETPGSSSAEVTIPASSVWLIHPGVPEWSMPITVAKFGDRSRKVQQGVFTPMGRRTPIVVTSGQRGSEEYSLSVYTADDAQRLALGTLLDDAGTVLLNVPAGKGFGVTSEYIAVGDVTETRPVRIAAESARIWELACQVVDRPEGGTQAQRTLLDLLDYPTLDSLKAAYPTLNDVLAGP